MAQKSGETNCIANIKVAIIPQRDNQHSNISGGESQQYLHHLENKKWFMLK